MKEMEIVKIIWEDAQTLDGFISHDEAMKTDFVLTETVGFLVGEDKKKVVVSFINFGDGITKYFQIIPKGMVKKIIKLKEQRRE